MSFAWPFAALVSRLFSRSGRRPRRVRSWLTRQVAAFVSFALDATSGSASADAQTVEAEAEGAPPSARAARRRGKENVTRRVRIYPPYRVLLSPPLGSQEPNQRSV